MRTLVKPISLLFAIVTGFFFSERLSVFSLFSSPILFLMLFLSMCRIEKIFEKRLIKPATFTILAPFLIGLCFYVCLLILLPNYKQEVTSSALIILSPLATTAVVMVKATGGNIGFTVMCIMFSHFFTVLFWPIFVYFSGFEIDLTLITIKLLKIVLVPFFLSRIVVKTSIKKMVHKVDFISFYLWVFCVLVNIALVSQMLKNGEIASKTLKLMAVLSLLIFSINYLCGLLFSKKTQFPNENLQMFVQRNTIFGIWIATSFFSPILAICPIFYIIFQNAYNSLRLILIKR